jgi:hypothetical protein
MRRTAGLGSLAIFAVERASWHWSARNHDGSLSAARPIAGGCGAGRRTSRAWLGRRARSRSSMRTPQGRRSWSPPTSRIRATGSVVRLSLDCRPALLRLFGSPCVRVGLRRLWAPRSTSTSPQASRLALNSRGIVGSCTSADDSQPRWRVRRQIRRVCFPATPPASATLSKPSTRASRHGRCAVQHPELLPRLTWGGVGDQGRGRSTPSLLASIGKQRL